MEFTYDDRQSLYQAWMSYKAKLRITQIEMAKRLGISQLDFSRILRGDVPLEKRFVMKFCRELGLEADQVLPSLKSERWAMPHGAVTINTSVVVDGNITRVEYSGNQVYIEYEKEV